MMLAIAERANVGGVDASQREHFRAYWRAKWSSERRVRYMLGLNSMIAGCQSRQRMTRLLGLPADIKTINLLWPDCVPGTWDHREALVSAIALMQYMAERTAKGVPTFTHLVLLGRRVAKAFAVPDDAEWGARFDMSKGDADWRLDENGPLIVLPHPSGRSTILSDPHLGAVIRARVARFVGEINDRLPHAPAGPD